MNFRSAISGRWVARLFARSNPATTASESSAKTVTFTTPNPYPFPTITGVGGPFKAQIRCRHCDKLTPIDAACRWCQSELDGGDAA